MKSQTVKMPLEIHTYLFIYLCVYLFILLRVFCILMACKRKMTNLTCITTPPPPAWTYLVFCRIEKLWEFFSTDTHGACSIIIPFFSIVFAVLNSYLLKIFLSRVMNILITSYSENIGRRSFLYGPCCSRSVLSRPRADTLLVLP